MELAKNLHRIINIVLYLIIILYLTFINKIILYEQNDLKTLH